LAVKHLQSLSRDFGPRDHTTLKISGFASHLATDFFAKTVTAIGFWRTFHSWSLEIDMQ